MNILISQKICLDKHGVPVDSLERNYIDYFSEFGFRVFPVSNFSPDLSHFFNLEIGGVVLTGGNDVEEKNDYVQFRNNQENKLVRFAMEKKIPLFGVCHGMQFIHHVFGGKLKKAENHVACTHTLRLAQGLLHTEFLDNKAIVNSYHNFAIDEETISVDFQIFARAEDGIVEGIIHKKLPILGIQWHPERIKLRQDNNFNKRLINNFFGLSAK